MLTEIQEALDAMPDGAIRDNLAEVHSFIEERVPLPAETYLIFMSD